MKQSQNIYRPFSNQFDFRCFVESVTFDSFYSHFIWLAFKFSLAWHKANIMEYVFTQTFHHEQMDSCIFQEH